MTYEFLRVILTSLTGAVLAGKLTGKLWDWWHGDNS